jgi:hypothetical protein
MIPPVGTGTVQCPRIFRYLPFLGHDTPCYITYRVLAAFLQESGESVLWIRIGFNSDPEPDPDPALLVIADPDSVADPDPGSGAFLTLDPGYGIGFFRIPDPKSIFLQWSIFWSKTDIYLEKIDIENF